MRKVCPFCKEELKEDKSGIKYTLMPLWQDIVENIEEISKITPSWKLGHTIKYINILQEPLKQAKTITEIKQIIEEGLPPNKKDSVFLLQMVLCSMYAHFMNNKLNKVQLLQCPDYKCKSVFLIRTKGIL